MFKRNLKLFATVLFSALLLAIFTVSAMAAITVEDGKIIGLEANKSYEYASVTLANNTNPTYSSVSAGATTIEGLTPGIWFVRETGATAVTAVWVPGEEEDRNGICELDYTTTYPDGVIRAVNNYSNKLGVVSDFIPGTWTGTEAQTHSSFGKYMLSAVGNHVTPTVSSNLYNKKISSATAAKELQKVFFRYAYMPEEIIPVEDLLAMSFKVGTRQGSITASYSDIAIDPSLKTKYVLYTMDKTGTVTTHEVTYSLDITTSQTKYTHSLNIGADFPEAKGWVVGIDIYPYGVIPLKGLTLNGVPNADGTFTTNCYLMEYVPEGYGTVYNSKSITVPFQYNGANTAYIEGYGDNTFKPDNNITKAEAATILTRIILGKNSIPAGLGTKFSDYSVNDWFYNEVNYLETNGIFNYITGSRLYPEKEITRGEFAQIIFNIIKPTEVDTENFKDIDADSDYYTAICTLADLGIVNGYEDKTFRPEAKLTRAEAITVINRMINLKADSTTVVKDTLETRFNDINGHWAEYQILMASNNNVKSVNHLKHTASDIIATDTTIEFETNHLEVVIDRATGKVSTLTSKYDSALVHGATAKPWFTYIVADSGINFYPKALNIVDNRLEVVYSNDIKAYFLIDVQDGFFTVELDSQLPIGIYLASFANLAVRSEFSNDDPESYRLSAVPMNANTNAVNYPGGSAKVSTAEVMRATGSTMGGKIGVTFSKLGDKKTGAHRAYLKAIVDAVDESVGLKSTHGAPYVYENDDLFGDYVIPSSIDATKAAEIAQILEEYSIDQLDLHQGNASFIQGEFNFKCAAKNGQSFTTAAEFKERVGDILTSTGSQIGLHTYSSLVSSSATTILSDPKWQRDLIYDKNMVLTLEEDVTASTGSSSIISRTFKTLEDASGIKLVGEAAGGGTSTLPWSGPNTSYFLIDEEIIFAKSVSADGIVVAGGRAKCGTTAAAHKAGTEIRHLLGHYSMFQPTPGSDLFYHVADLTAQAYNDGGFEMIYLDGLESFARPAFCDTNLNWYYYSTFVQRVVSGCDKDPIIEGSNIGPWFWAARGRAGAVDNARRQYKKYNYNHATYNRSRLECNFFTSTLGWFNYAPDKSELYKNTFVKTLFRDDIDHMGSLGIAFNMSSVYNHNMTEFDNATLAHNAKYYSLYSKLRKAHYFSDTVRDTLYEGYLDGKEYKLEEQTDGSWAFREMKYVNNRIFDMADDTFITGNATNPFDAQTPYIRIEQRYSTLGANEVTLIEFDETAEVKSLAGTHTFTQTNIDAKRAFKINVTGNGIDGSAVLLSVRSSASSEAGRLDFFIPTHFTGTREFILIDMDNADYDGYSFSGISISQTNYEAYRNNYNYSLTTAVKVVTTGDCTGVKIDDLRACTMVNAPVTNPSVTVGNSKITFNATVRSGEFIEFIPELNEAYLHAYNTSGQGNGNTPTVSKITFAVTDTATGDVADKFTVPAGEFSYTYGATATTAAPTRARVTLGLQSSELIANEDSWNAVLPELEEDIQYITLK